MRPENIYEEKIFSKWIVAILVVTMAFLLCLFFYQAFIGQIGSRPAPTWILLAIVLFFLAIMINFISLNIKANSQSITVGYGVFQHTILWANIEDCYLDETSIIRYGGWGIRIARIKGKWKLVYNIIGGPCVVIALRMGTFREFVFSTQNPEQVMKIIKQQIGGKKD